MKEIINKKIGFPFVVNWNMISSLLLIFLSINFTFLIIKINILRTSEKNQWLRAESNSIYKKLLIDWMEQKSQGKEIVTYFRKYEIKKVAIYGMAEIGKLLYEELKDTEIDIVYGIDRQADHIKFGIPIMKPEKAKKNVDAIIVTPVYYFEEIYDLLKEKIGGSIPIIGVDEIIYNL